MAIQSSQADVDKVLQDVRIALTNNKICFIRRRKNMNTLSQLGILISDVRDELLNLTFSDYISGPEVDRDFPSTDKFWIFKRRVNGQVIFKAEYQVDGKVRVVSFHIDEPIST